MGTWNRLCQPYTSHLFSALHLCAFPFVLVFLTAVLTSLLPFAAPNAIFLR